MPAVPLLVKIERAGELADVAEGSCLKLPVADPREAYDSNSHLLSAGRRRGSDEDTSTDSIRRNV